MFALHAMILSSLVLSADKPAEKTEAEEKKQLEGQWIMRGLPAGEPGDGYFASIIGITEDKVTGMQIRINSGEPPRTVVIWEGKYRLDVMKKPRQIDIRLTSGQDKGKTVRGLYHFKEGHLRLCLAKPGDDRPAKFGAEKVLLDGMWYNPSLTQLALEGPFDLPFSKTAEIVTGAPQKEVALLDIASNGALFHGPKSEEIKELNVFLKTHRAAHPKSAKIGLRADHLLQFAKLSTILNSCKEQGFSVVEMRVARELARDEKDQDDLDRFLEMPNKIREGRFFVSLEEMKNAPSIELVAPRVRLPFLFLSHYVLNDGQGKSITLREVGKEREEQLIHWLRSKATKTIALRPESPIVCKVLIETLDQCKRAGVTQVQLLPFKD